MRHFLTIRDFNQNEIKEILELAQKLKNDLKNNIKNHPLEGKTLGMIFEKSSTRTRVSFETGIYQLGGMGLFLSSKDIQLGRGEPIKDTARVLSRMLDLVMIRTYSHTGLEEFAQFSSIPVINGLSDDFHPMQVLADYLTMIEHNKASHPIVAWIGDGNNMTHSWMMMAGVMGFELRIATPQGYEVNEVIKNQAIQLCQYSGGKILFTHDPKEAVSQADVVTTDVWASMGQEDEYHKRLKDFQGFTVNKNLMALAKNDAILLHCLPAHRGEEVDEDVFEKHSTVIFDEAENRLHIQKGVMVWLDQHRND